MTDPGEERYRQFPDGFCARFDEDDDGRFSGELRLARHP